MVSSPRIGSTYLSHPDCSHAPRRSLCCVEAIPDQDPFHSIIVRSNYLVRGRQGAEVQHQLSHSFYMQS